MILVNYAQNSVFQTHHRDKNRNLMKNVACANLICNTINVITVILNLLTSLLIDEYRRDTSTCAYDPDISTFAYRGCLYPG